MSSFMKILLVKRLESSFFAFNKTIDRFIKSYENFIKAYNNNIVFISKKYIKKILEYIDNDDYDKIYKIIEDGNAKKYDAKDFNPNLITDLNNDLQILKQLKMIGEKSGVTLN